MNKILKYILLIVVSFIFLFPLLWVVLSSLKPQSELFTYPLTILPHSPTLENYVKAFASGDFVTYYKNSIFVSVVATLLTITINVMADTLSPNSGSEGATSSSTSWWAR